MYPLKPWTWRRSVFTPLDVLRCERRGSDGRPGGDELDDATGRGAASRTDGAHGVGDQG